MENNLVNQNKRQFLSGVDGLFFVKQLFKKQLINFEPIHEYNDIIYWGITYVHHNIVIKFKSGRGLLEFNLQIDNEYVNLYTYYNIECSILVANKEEILFAFNLILKYLHEKQKK